MTKQLVRIWYVGNTLPIVVESEEKAKEILGYFLGLRRGEPGAPNLLEGPCRAFMLDGAVAVTYESHRTDLLERNTQCIEKFVSMAEKEIGKGEEWRENG